jgi:hypothetical protein
MTGSLQLYGRLKHTATLLPDGRVLIAAGQTILNPNFGDNGAELYDPTTGTWTITDTPNTARTLHVAALLPDGHVLVAGGRSSSDEISAELYTPPSALPTRVSGRGSVAGQGDSATFNLHAKSGERPTGSISYSDLSAGVTISKAKIRTLTFNGNSADLTGVARLDSGTKATFSVSVSDVSSDGSTDTFSLSLSNGYSAGGTLTSGNIKIE